MNIPFLKIFSAAIYPVAPAATETNHLQRSPSAGEVAAPAPLEAEVKTTYGCADSWELISRPKWPDAITDSDTYRRESVHYYLQHGKVLEAQERTEEAVQAYSKATFLLPHCEQAHWRLGQLYLNQGESALAAVQAENTVDLLDAPDSLFSDVPPACRFTAEQVAELDL